MAGQISITLFGEQFSIKKHQPKKQQNQIWSQGEKSFWNKRKMNISGEVLFPHFSALQLHLEYCIQLGPQQKKAVDKLQGVQHRPARWPGGWRMLEHMMCKERLRELDLFSPDTQQGFHSCLTALLSKFFNKTEPSCDAWQGGIHLD